MALFHITPTARILPKEIAENPNNPNRIEPFLIEIQDMWKEKPQKTFGQIFAEILHNEYGFDKTGFIEELTDDEIVAAIQNYRNKI